MNKIYDLEAEVSLLKTRDGGRSTAVMSGYRGAFALAENWHTSGEQDYIEVQTLNPGESAMANVRILSPLENSLWVDRIISIHEGAKIVGSAKITKIFNAKLLKDS